MGSVEMKVKWMIFEVVMLKKLEILGLGICLGKW